MPLVDLGFSEPCGPDFVTILSFSLFIVGPSAEYLPGGNAGGLLSFRAFIECGVTPSDRPNSLVYVHHFPAEGDDALLCEEFRHYGKIVSCKHQYFSGRPNLLTGSRTLTMSVFRPIPAEVMVDVYWTRVWYHGMQPFCQICKTMGRKAADCEFYGKCKECGAADHRARDCASRRGGRVWSSEPIVVKATVSPAVAETFPSIPVPEVAAAPPGVVVTEEVPDPSGVFIRSQ